MRLFYFIGAIIDKFRSLQDSERALPDSDRAR
jgi:hypothetical protein